MSERHLRVYINRSELVLADGTIQYLPEGGMNQAAKRRYRKIISELSTAYLEKQIIVCRDNSCNLNFSELAQEQKNILDRLVQSVTSEVGRALVGLTILQLCVKSIEPEQNIRLHKGSAGTKDFSWCDGISMRSLDKQYITPVLRKYELLRLNADGFMMTRSLAENYPKEQFTRTLEEVVTENELASAWITAYTESLAQQRRDIAPIDEPCYQWLLTLNETLIDV